MLKAAEQGDLYCQRWAGERYLKGEGLKKDEREASRWYRRASEQGDAESQKILGDMYRYGQGLDRDEVSAEGWYRKAAEAGSEKARDCLNFMAASRDAERGDSSAAFRLGSMYESGAGTEKDYGMAMKLYLKAASGGSADAMLRLGNIYDRSECGAEADKDKAAEWYSKAFEVSGKAANDGSADDQYRLGIMLREGGALSLICRRPEDGSAGRRISSIRMPRRLLQIFISSISVSRGLTEGNPDGRMRPRSKLTPRHRHFWATYTALATTMSGITRRP